jgi:hypothetical protein
MAATKYFGGWNNRESVRDDFFPQGHYDGRYPVPADFPSEDEILFAWYDRADYSGAALVVFERDGKLYQVNGGHCSCYGLEGQWEPEETSAEVLGMRAVHVEDYSSYGPHMDDDAVEYWRELFPKFTPLDHEPRQ